MDAGQKQYLEERYRAKEWHGRSQYANRKIKGFTFAGSEVRGWKLQRTERDERAKPPVIHSLWSRGEAGAEILSIDVWECPSVEAAHDELLEALANMESGEIQRRTGTNAPGDVAFGLNDTMVLFARVHLVVLIRNAGPKVVPVGAIAAGIDAVLVSRLESESRKKR
jgi:hypothetical protein